MFLDTLSFFKVYHISSVSHIVQKHAYRIHDHLETSLQDHPRDPKSTLSVTLQNLTASAHNQATPCGVYHRIWRSNSHCGISPGYPRGLWPPGRPGRHTWWYQFKCNLLSPPNLSFTHSFDKHWQSFVQGFMEGMKQKPCLPEFTVLEETEQTASWWKRLQTASQPWFLWGCGICISTWIKGRRQHANNRVRTSQPGNRLQETACSPRRNAHFTRANNEHRLI